MVLGRLTALAFVTLVAAAPAGPRDGRDMYFGLTGPAQSCASCHGLAGQGGSEGGTVIPEIQSMFADGGRYTDAGRLCRVLVDGIAADGRKLAQSMPRYALTVTECEALARYLTDRDERMAPGVDADRIAVRITPVPTSSAQRRWRDVLIERFDAVNRSGGVYGRRIEVMEGAGPTTFLIALDSAGALPDNAAVRLSLREAGADPATRGIESTAEAELTALLAHLHGAGARDVTWIDDERLGPEPDALRLLAVEEGLSIQDRELCQRPRVGALVVISATRKLPAACANADQIYVSLRGVAVDALPAILEHRAAGRPLHMFAGQPLDAAFSTAPSLLADIIVNTSRRMTARPTELRVVSALDLAWRQLAEDQRSLFAGVAVQQLAWPALTTVGSATWERAPR